MGKCTHSEVLSQSETCSDTKPRPFRAAGLSYLLKDFCFLTMHGDEEGHLVNFNHLQESNLFSKFLPKLHNLAPLMEAKRNK